MPKPIRDAQTKARSAVDALEGAKRNIRDAESAVEAAPDVDAKAIGRAAREGSKPPAVTEHVRKAELRAAREVRWVLDGDASSAIGELHRAVVSNLHPAIAAQQEAVTPLRDKAHALAQELGEVMTELERESRVLVGLASADEHTTNKRRGRRYTRIVNGTITFDRPRVPGALSVIPPVRAVIDQLGCGVDETVGERQEREEREREEQPHMPRNMLGAVVVR